MRMCPAGGRTATAAPRSTYFDVLSSSQMCSNTRVANSHVLT
jgi:hypothetical protein